MKDIFSKISLLVYTLILAVSFLFLFFGGTWEGVRFALELFGAIYILQLSYSVLVKEKQEKQDERDLKDYLKKERF